MMPAKGGDFVGRWFYLHFRHAPPPEVVPFLEAQGCTVERVYETSFDVISPVSFSDFRHLLKKEFPQAECLVILPKNARQISSGE